LRDKHLPQEIIEILKAVADLRNSVAHKSVMGGMTAGQRVGEKTIYVSYKGVPVFDELDEQGNLKNLCDPTHSGVNEVTLQHLVMDVARAITELNRSRVTLLGGPDGA